MWRLDTRRYHRRGGRVTHRPVLFELCGTEAWIPCSIHPHWQWVLRHCQWIEILEMRVTQSPPQKKLHSLYMHCVRFTSGSQTYSNLMKFQKYSIFVSQHQNFKFYNDVVHTSSERRWPNIPSRYHKYLSELNYVEIQMTENMRTILKQISGPVTTPAPIDQSCGGVLEGKSELFGNEKVNQNWYKYQDELIECRSYHESEDS